MSDLEPVFDARTARPNRRPPLVLAIVIIVTPLILFLPYFIYTQCRIEIPTKHMAILIRKTGKDLENGQEIAPKYSAEEGYYKGVQQEVLPEGRFFRNPYLWDWVVVPQVEIPEGELGVRIRLHGDNLPPGELIAQTDQQKGIVEQVLRPGRYPLNAWVKGEPKRPDDSYAEHIELFDPVTVEAGFRGVVTLLTAPLPDAPNELIVEEGKRGVQEKTLKPGTYYVNPYVTRINLIDCRSQRFNLAEGGDMGFPSKDGFFVTLDGIVEFRVMEEQASLVYVNYNDIENGEEIDEEIVAKIILPNARSFCRLRGSSHLGKDFFGEERGIFQANFEQALKETCLAQGIDIRQALITKNQPPKQIIDPIKERQIALQTEKQYRREILEQKSKQELAVETETVKQKQALVAAEQEVVKVVTEAKRKQEVALIEANQRLAVAEFQLNAAKDQAAAVLARGQAAADVIGFNNEAAAAGWKRSVEAFGGDGDEFARWTMLKKLAPSYRGMMINTDDSPLMDIFNAYQASAIDEERAPSAPEPDTAATDNP